MERDFMGLNSMDSSIVVAVKEEVEEGASKDSGYARSAGLQWPLSNKVSALPHFAPKQDEKPPKVNSDLLVSHGHVQKSGQHIMDAINKRHLGEVQNFAGHCKQQFIGGYTLPSAHDVLSQTASAAGTTDQWINSKASTPAQLTIFYAGTVNVFDDISPEKAQAIMFLAGNSCISSNMAQSKHHVSKFPGSDRALVNQSMINVPPPCSGLLSPLSVSSHPIDQSNVSVANQDDVKVPITIGMSTVLVNKGEPPRMISSMGSVAAATAMISSAVPQARKASLARFLEKRKERVMNASPYNLSKKAANCPTPDSNGLGFSASSGVGSSPVSAPKETTGET